MHTYIVTLLPGSGIGSAFVGIIAALYYLKINNIEENLLINTYLSSEPVKWFINVFLNKEKITCVTFVDICDNGYKPIYINGDKYKELFFVKDTTNIYHDLQNKLIDFSIFTVLFSQIWILKDFIKDECNSLEKYDICINVRRGDKITLESHLPMASIESYIDEINKININNPKIMHTSDDYYTFIEIKDKIKDKIDYKIDTLCLENEKGYFLSELNNQNIEYNINHVRKFIKQLHFMTYSEYFIGTLSTNVGCIVQLLRQIRNDSKNIYI